MAKILIVDDERQIRRIISLLLKEQHHEVFEAATGEAALRLFEQAKPEIVLLDLSLPDIGGMQVLHECLKGDPGVKMIMMTAYGTIRSAVEAMQAGAYHYLAKPFDNDELLLLIERALQVRRLDREVDDLRRELEARYGFSEIIGVSPKMQEVFRVMAKVAAVDTTVLITGESGTGKELVARAIHRLSDRKQGPFVAVNCGAVPPTLFESEFFGHEQGAYTDARTSRTGRFQQASGGTLFLDEIGELPGEAQSKLLRVLQEQQVVPLGARNPISVDTRVMAATNRDLERAVRDGQFREDLFWRVNVVTIKLPPLRERTGDLPLLIDHMLGEFSKELGLQLRHMTDQARDLLLGYDWPGNVRELENTLRHALILCDGGLLTVDDLPPRIRGTEGHAGSSTGDSEQLDLADAVAQATERVEKALIQARLSEFKGSRTATAESLGISRKTLFNKMRAYGLE
ncbi:MAG: sigma-54 dependent transcriptional regulator [Acidobacteriota bacterium]